MKDKKKNKATQNVQQVEDVNEVDLSQDQGVVTEETEQVEVQDAQAQEETPEVVVDQTEKILAAAMEQVIQMREFATRTQADFDNFRRRNANVKQEAELEGKAAALGAMLPVLDNMERAIESAAQTTDVALREGIELIYKQLCDSLAQLGVEEIPTTDQPFDPQLHHAVLQEEGGTSGNVAQVLQKGYRMGERVLRYSMVKVYA